MKAVTAQFDFLKLINLPPTRGINREGYLFRGLLEVSIWDAGGQKKYMEQYFSDGERDRIFTEIRIPIFMIDATDFNPDYKETFRQFIENVKEFSPNVEKIYVLINKINLHEADPDQVYNIITDGLAEDNLKLIVNTPVSVKFGSAQKQLIEILNEVLQDSTSEMQKLNEIRSALENLKSQSDAEFFLFNQT